MKGAMAEPLVSTISPPKVPSRTSSGRSQSFLRARMKAQSSPASESMVRSSELVLQAVRGRPRRLAQDPVGDGLAVTLEAQEILAEGAHHEPHRGEDEEEHRPHDDRAH